MRIQCVVCGMVVAGWLQRDATRRGQSYTSALYTRSKPKALRDERGEKNGEKDSNAGCASDSDAGAA